MMHRHRAAPDRDAAFRQAMDDAKARRNLSDVLARHTTFRKRGREKKGICPFHKERTPSFEVNDAKGVYYCHGCAATGDHFDALRTLDRLSFREAYQALTGDTFPDVDPADRARAIEEDAADRAAAIADTRLMWSRCVDPAGTPAERYLRDVRGITIQFPPSVRFGVVPPSRDEEGNWKAALPAVVLSCTDGTGEITGLQRVFITDDGSGKRWGKRSKLSLGRPRGSAVKLSGGDGAEVIICEGPEDGLSLMQGFPGREVWVALGTAMMPELVFPPRVTAVAIARQNDEPALVAAEKARTAFLKRGLAVRIIAPDPAFKDWNDQLLGVRA